MTVEFHFYAIYVLAMQAGFEESEAWILANASQYIDAAIRPLSFAASARTITIGPTQNYQFWDETVCAAIYQPFHFLPGDAADIQRQRLDGSLNLYSVSANGTLAKQLLVEALHSNDLYRIGIALHSFADTWAHQNFSGRNEAWNDLTRLGGQDWMGLRLPAAGHLQALTAPDEPDRVWQDKRLKPDYAVIRNHQRFRQAAGKIYRYLCLFRKRSYGDEDQILDRLERIWRKPTRDERLTDYVIDWHLPAWSASDWQAAAGVPASRQTAGQFLGYSQAGWLKSRLDELLDGEAGGPPIVVDSGFFQTDLYRWQEAANEHRRQAQRLMAERGLA
ncbi:MAG: hypothetical protein A2087_08825 [Spirochaetes bacterium GWD1_61_31]|nr:MAG: hypothetical protein A2Y37_14510 [Spirochaetes bacterium GWB1_60_80]OHD38071.1 MAG: hypothetical protein A2087_08825 [Spirochaetes bacterium GWD1_61_31]OHD44557.1 MAG: hypothetical protein A2Y35_05350 [Spirochaetes bacterium GWE1_60_18]OHD58655.1 MAG: hypothetical protein A2Y32_03265 [Spirochaetes bacterium GWF1_60_12]HAP43214.1 hypothetical protein [Spirochaetaceae bacterium]